MKKILVMCTLMLLVASSAYSASIEFGWSANTESDLAGYRLYQTSQQGQYQYGSAKAVKQIPAGTQTCTLDVTADGTYYYVLTAYDTGGLESGPSNEVNVKVDTTAPAAPTGFWGKIIKMLIGWIRGGGMYAG